MYQSSISCTISGVDSDGSAGDLIVAENGYLIIIDINGIITDVSSQFARDVTTTFENINNFIIAAGQTVNILGTLIVKGKHIQIDGTLNGNGGGYLGAVATTTGSWQTATNRAWSGTTPICVIENEDRSFYLEYSTVNHVDGNGYTDTPRTPCRDENGNAVKGGQGQGGASSSGRESGGGGAGHGQCNKCDF